MMTTMMTMIVTTMTTMTTKADETRGNPNLFKKGAFGLPLSSKRRAIIKKRKDVNFSMRKTLCIVLTLLVLAIQVPALG